MLRSFEKNAKECKNIAFFWKEHMPNPGMRFLIQEEEWTRIQADPDPQPWMCCNESTFTTANWCFRHHLILWTVYSVPYFFLSMWFFAPFYEIVRVLREKRYLNPTSPTPHGATLALHLQSLASIFLLVLYIVDSKCCCTCQEVLMVGVKRSLL